MYLYIITFRKYVRSDLQQPSCRCVDCARVCACVYHKPMTKIAITYVIWKRYEILKKQGELNAKL